jgi:hypothetical protein
VPDVAIGRSVVGAGIGRARGRALPFTVRQEALARQEHAWFAWNQVMQALGCTPGMETAYTPGAGGLDPGTGDQLPSSGKFVGYAGLHDVAGLNCVAPPPVSSASVALPDCTCFTSTVFVGGICQTLAS